MQYTAKLRGQWSSFGTLPCYRGWWAVEHQELVGSGTSGVVGNGTPAIHRHTAQGQCAVELLRYTPHLRASGQLKLAAHCHTARGQWAVGILQYTAALHRAVGSGPHSAVHHTTWARGSAQRASCSTRPHCRGQGAVGKFQDPPHCRASV